MVQPAIKTVGYSKNFLDSHRDCGIVVCFERMKTSRKPCWPAPRRQKGTDELGCQNHWSGWKTRSTHHLKHSNTDQMHDEVKDQDMAWRSDPARHCYNAMNSPLETLPPPALPGPIAKLR